VEDARLPRPDHPCDGRKQGVSGEHLELLAHLHHRQLNALPKEPPLSVPAVPPSVPAELRALPQTIGIVQAQITALQQHVATLTSLLHQHRPPPPSPPPPVSPPGPATRSPNPPSPALRPRSTSSAPTTTPATPAHVIPRVAYDPNGRSIVICPTRGVLPFAPDTPEWFPWVATPDACRLVGKGGHFSAHQEWRVPKGAWRAHRPLRNHNPILRLAPHQERTVAVLEQAAEALHAHLLEPLAWVGFPPFEAFLRNQKNGASETGFAHHSYKEVPL